MNEKISQLRPKVKRLAQKLVAECQARGVGIVITSCYRSFEDQDKLYAKGRAESGKIVTNARGGYSMHNYGVAFDICPIENGKLNWSNLLLFAKIGRIGESIGLEWGGAWKAFTDKPHFQYTAGYKLDDFLKNRVDWKKFD
ncbi:M15 family metallopeptidase [Candidatus Falkowbacteria bacterium]|nr:M15 family metallopeptidase [Candidatus Falkowbacteria bacterium]